MAIDMQSRCTVGCSYYLARSETLYLMEDVMLGGADIADGLKTMIQPTCVLAPSRCHEALLDKLDPEKRARVSTVANGLERDEFALPYTLELAFLPVAVNRTVCNPVVANTTPVTMMLFSPVLELYVSYGPSVSVPLILIAIWAPWGALSKQIGMLYVPAGA